jgi:membrane protein implicated in regulation of membrane protease activity
MKILRILWDFAPVWVLVGLVVAPPHDLRWQTVTIKIATLVTLFVCHMYLQDMLERRRIQRDRDVLRLKLLD